MEKKPQIGAMESKAQIGAMERMLCSLIGIQPSELGQTLNRIGGAINWFVNACKVIDKDNKTILANQALIMEKLQIERPLENGAGSGSPGGFDGDSGNAVGNVVGDAAG